ncbi:hypothetical protein PIB30_065011 [Stylosanthes scabra]|uniref:Uncharacterized protein n=1 Tax=Stylosanthes scabra TaxID=79078 RepID=A0ABU6WK80_9FABA|nr:hypothetical protein [Stylosanthes scabra]
MEGLALKSKYITRLVLKHCPLIIKDLSFRYLFTASKFHQKLMVPKCFSNEYWKRMSNRIKLELPDGVEKKEGLVLNSKYVYDNTALRVAYYNIHENNNNKDSEETVADGDENYCELEGESSDDESHELLNNNISEETRLTQESRFKIRMRESYVGEDVL